MFIARQCGWIESLGVGLAFILAAIAFQLRANQHTQPIRWIAGIGAIIVIWAVGVDWSVFKEGCDQCRSHWNVFEFRFFGLPAYQWHGQDHSPTLRRIAEDLGAPCPHRFHRIHLIRAWGLVYPSPCISGTCCLDEGDWYDDKQRALARMLAERDPELGPEFRRRVLLGRDFVYLKKFYSDLKAESAATSNRTDEIRDSASIDQIDP